MAKIIFLEVLGAGGAVVMGDRLQFEVLPITTLYATAQPQLITVEGQGNVRQVGQP